MTIEQHVHRAIKSPQAELVLAFFQGWDLLADELTRDRRPAEYKEPTMSE